MKNFQGKVDIGIKNRYIDKQNRAINLQDWLISGESNESCTTMNIIKWKKDHLSGNIWTLDRKAFVITDDSDGRGNLLKEYSWESQE